MSFSKFKNVCTFALVISTVCAMSGLHAQRDEFLRVDQPFLQFKAISGAKYPWMLKAQPSINQIDVLLFGFKKGDQVKLVKKPTDLATLVPVQCEFKDADAGLKVNQKYRGFRTTYFGKTFEELFALIGLLSNKNYKGTPLVDEYKDGMPMKWVFSTADQFRATAQYLKSNLDAQGFVPAAQKPLLLLEITKRGEALNSADFEFLDAYFDVCDPLNNEVKAFFEGCQKTLGDMISATKDAVLVGQDVGEVIFDAFEKRGEKFDSEKWAPILAAMVGGLVGSYIKSELTAAIEASNVYANTRNLITTHVTRDRIKNLALAGATAATGVILYNVWRDYCSKQADEECNNGCAGEQA